MVSTTVRLKISGSNYYELLLEAEKILSEFFCIDRDELNSKISYEILAKEQDEIVDFEDEDLYIAEVIAKVKDDGTTRK